MESMSKSRQLLSLLLKMLVLEKDCLHKFEEPKREREQTRDFLFRNTISRVENDRVFLFHRSGKAEHLCSELRFFANVKVALLF